MLGFVHPVLVGVVACLDLHVAQLLFGMRTRYPQGGHSVDDIDRQAEAIDLVADGELQRRVDAPHLFVTAHVQILVIRAPVGEAMNEPRIAVKVEDDGLVHGEQAVKIPVVKAVRMLALGLHTEQINDVDESDLQVGEMLAQHSGGRKRLLGWNVTTTSDDHVGLAPFIVARPFPNTYALGAMGDRRVHVEELQM